MSEDEDIIRFREAQMTWKHWVYIAIALLVTYIFVTGLVTIFDY